MIIIMKNLFARLKLAYAIAVVTYKEWAAYRTHSMVSIFVGPAWFLAQVSIWRAVYSDGSMIGGMSLNEMITYYGISTLIGYLVMDFADWNLQMLIRTGKYTTYALRPMHHRFFALSQKLGHRTLGFLFEFLPVLALFTLLFRFDPRPASWLWALLSIALGFLVQFYINYCIGLIGFWLVRTQGIRHIIHLLTSICSGAMLPLVMLPQAVQGIAFFLPFQYTVYVPSMVFSGTYRLGAFSMGIESIVGIQALYCLALLLLSELLYRLGMKRFTAAGA